MDLGTAFFMLIIGLVFVAFTVLINYHSQSHLTKPEREKFKSEMDEWVKKHPFWVLTYFLLPAPIGMIVASTIGPEMPVSRTKEKKRDEREVHNPLAEKEIQYPLVQNIEVPVCAISDSQT